MPIDAQTEAVGSDNPTLAFNLAPVNDWSTALPFIDLAHMMRSWIGHMPGRWGGWGEAELRAGGYLDADGWLVRMPPELASVGSFFEAQFASAGRRGTFVMTYEGEGTIQLNNVRVISQTPGRITFESATGDGFWFNITATDPSRTGNYIRDISIVHQDNLALHEAGAVFNPDWLALIADARQIRFMDWMETNNSTQSSWANRPHEDKYTWAGGVPVEVMVQLANEIGADPWFNMPHLATDDYIRQFATYVRDHLDPNLTARVEWSNEMWNGAFAHSQILLQGSRAAWGVDAPHDYHAMKATQTALIWEEVFAQATGPVADLVNVLGSHTHNPWISGRLLDPSVWRQRDPGGYTPPADVFEELAIASYFGTAVVSNTNYRTELLNRINQSPADATAWLAQRLMDPAFETSIPYDQNFWRQNADIAHQYGLGLVAYEGGQHVHHSFAVGGLTEAQVTQLTTFMSNFIRSPQMGTLYQNLWDAWAAVGDGPMMQFQEAGAASRWGSWGLLSHLDDSTPRSQALFDRARTATPWWETAANAAYQHGVNTTGTALADTLTGTAQEDYLAGQDGNDTLIGGAGADGLSGGTGNDSLDGGTDADFLRGGLGIDQLRGGGGADTFSGSAAELNGDTIADFQAGDRIVFTDATAANFRFSLSGNTLTYTGGSLTLGTVPTGSIAASADADGGVQLVIVQGTEQPPPEPTPEPTPAPAPQPAPPPADSVIEGTAGNDTLHGTSGNDTMRGYGGDDALNGGGAGSDMLIGGTGNDSYYVENGNNVIVEQAGEGTEWVHAAVSHALAANVENLALTGIAAIGGTGNELANFINGNGGANRLSGEAGDDILDGGADADTLVGGSGNDSYYVDNTGDSVVEQSGEGVDWVFASASYTLSANVENLELTGTAAVNGTGNGLANIMNGNAAANLLSGGAGHDTLDGGAGADTLVGGIGDDTFHIDSIGDVVTELAGEGNDWVHAAVSYSLAANVENLTLTGTAALSGTGNALGNIINGNGAANSLSGAEGNDILNGGAGADVLNGGAGNDRLEGGAGRDTLTGGKGADTFVFRSGDLGLTTATADVIKDFTQAQGDRIDLSGIDANAILAGDQAFQFLGTGNFTGNAGQLRYDAVRGGAYLYGDINGDGSADFVIQLAGSKMLTGGDFLL